MVLPLLYVGVVGLYFLIFSGKRKVSIRATNEVLLILVFLHGAFMVSRMMTYKHLPFSTLADAFSFLAFSILAIYLWIEFKVQNQGSGLFVLTFSGVFACVSAVTSQNTPQSHALFALRAAA